MKKIPLLLLMLVAMHLSCVDTKSAELSHGKENSIDHYIEKAMKLHNIPGLAIAVIQDDRVIYQNYFGKSSLEQNKDVDENTLFRVFSATKLVTSVGIFQLIEKGEVRLEDEISKFLDNLPTAWRKIKVENLLSHSSGLPDMIRYKWDLTDEQLMEKLSKDSMDFETGNQFRYNQTNYWLLSQIIEKVSGLSFAEFIVNGQFNNSSDKVLFSSNATDTVPNRATRYFYNYKTTEFNKDTNNSGTRGFSGNGLNITLDEFVKWNHRLDHNELLSNETKQLLWTPFDYKNGIDKFLHGWGIYNVNTIKSIGFSGGNCAGFRKFLKHNTTIILVSNGYLHPAYDIIVNDVARMTLPELIEKNVVLEEDIMALVVNKRYEKVTSLLAKLLLENGDSEFDNLKWNINGIGNALNYNNDIAAFDVYNLLSDVFPQWWVPKAGLAETHEKHGDTIKAIASYQNAITLNKNNEWGYNHQMNDQIKKLKNN